MTQVHHPEPTPSPSQSGCATHGDDVLAVSRRLVRIAIGALAIVLIPYVFSFAENGPSGDPARWGEFGDYVGGLLNPTIALMALVLLYQGVKLQKHELEAARAALGESNAVMQAQHLAMQKQALETTFFQLLKLLSNTVQALNIKSPHPAKTEPLASGRGVIDFIRNDLVRRYRNDIDLPAKDEQQEVAALQHLYHIVVVNFYDQWLPYVRALQLLLDYVETSPFSDRDRSFYTGVIRAQISHPELVLLFYHCLCSSDKNEDRVAALMVKFKLLDGVERTRLVTPDHYEFMSRILERFPAPTDPAPHAP